jgi:outer membrane protein assembly factor BamA
VLYFDNGDRDDVKFEYTPYRHRVFLQGYATTDGWQYHWADYDGLYLGDSPFRLRALFIYERNTAAQYFGAGEAALGDLGFSQTGQTYETYAALQDDIRAVSPAGVTHAAYNRYLLESPRANVTIERDFWGGRIRTQGGVAIQYSDVRTYDGRIVEGDDPSGSGNAVKATQGVTKLTEDCEAGIVQGCRGGWNNTLKLGIALDTRDFEPDPNAGVFFDITGELSNRAIGSTYDYGRLTLSPRFFWSPLRKLTDLVLAGRIAYSMQTDDVPFFAMNTLAFTDGNRTGLGGLRTLRGFRQDRFIGKTMMVGNLEARWTFVNFRALKQRFGLTLVPFVDAGRVFDRPEVMFTKMRVSGGAGLRILWNQATVVVADYGMSSEDAGFYLNFNHVF